METLVCNLTTGFLFVSDLNIQSIVSGISTRLRCIFQISNVMVLVSLRKHPFLLALRRWGRFARNPVAKSEEKRMFSQARFWCLFNRLGSLSDEKGDEKKNITRNTLIAAPREAVMKLEPRFARKNTQYNNRPRTTHLWAVLFAVTA